jgi:Flp pilus assembly protein TadD
MALAFSALLVGCVTTASQNRERAFGDTAWRRVVAEAGVDPDAAVYPFETTPEMVRWAHEKVDRYTTLVPSQRLVMLQAAMFNPSEFTFDYDETLTLTAAEAFDARRGNCLSFTVLFVAMSRELGMPAFLVLVDRLPEVQKDQNVVVVNRHVVAGYVETGKMHLYDFYESSETPLVHRRVVDDVTASAMYHTNLGADGLRSGDLDKALRNLDIATTIAPEWPPGWINLGVALVREGRRDAAMDAYRTALEMEPGNPSALTNMAIVYRKMGQEEAARDALRAAAEGPSSPFTLIALADAEMTQGNLRDARRYLQRARRSYGREPDVYDALSRLARRSGQHRKAQEFEQRASELRAAADSDA